MNSFVQYSLIKFKISTHSIFYIGITLTCRQRENHIASDFWNKVWELTWKTTLIIYNDYNNCIEMTIITVLTKLMFHV